MRYGSPDYALHCQKVLTFTNRSNILVDMLCKFLISYSTEADFKDLGGLYVAVPVYELIVNCSVEMRLDR